MAAAEQYRIFDNNNLDVFKRNLRTVTKTSLVMLAYDVTTKPIVHISSRNRLRDNVADENLMQAWRNQTGTLLATQMICDLLPTEKARKIANDSIKQINVGGQNGQIEITHDYRIISDDINTLAKILQQELIDYYNPALLEAYSARQEKLQVLIPSSMVDKDRATGFNKKWKKNDKGRF